MSPRMNQEDSLNHIHYFFMKIRDLTFPAPFSPRVCGDGQCCPKRNLLHVVCTQSQPQNEWPRNWGTFCSFHKTIVQKLWARTTPQIAFLRDSSWPIFIILLHCWETLCKQVCSARVRILQNIWAWTNYSPIVTEQFLSPKQTKRMSVEARKCTLRPAEKFQPQLSKSGNVPSLIASSRQF
jgi:hypothetical protein